VGRGNPPLPDPPTVRELAVELRDRIRCLLPQEPGSESAVVDPEVKGVLLRVQSLLQALLSAREAEVVLNGAVARRPVADQLQDLYSILIGPLPAAVGQLQNLVVSRFPLGSSPVSLRGEEVVDLGRFGQPVRVRGREKSPLTLPQHKVIRALLAAGEQGLAKDELERVHSDARGILRRLRAADPDWRAVIHFAGQAGRRYRIG
jgi:hypothetical protein